MARTVKMTFTLDEETALRINRTAQRLDMTKSAVVREAVADYAARAGRLSDQERRGMLQVFDHIIARIPLRPARTTDAELAALLRARKQSRRRTPHDVAGEFSSGSSDTAERSDKLLWRDPHA